VLATPDRNGKDAPRTAVPLAWVYAGLGDRDHAFAALVRIGMRIIRYAMHTLTFQTYTTSTALRAIATIKAYLNRNPFVAVAVRQP
jgi:hypothetical protein